MARPEKEESDRELHEGDCAKRGDVFVCREHDRIERYPIEETRGSVSETSVIGFILGLLGIVLLPLPFIGISSALLAVLFSGVGLYQTRQGLRRGFGIAMAGFVMGLLAILIFVIFLSTILSMRSSISSRL
ncbi:MAG: DUF4190 domain-containing protein [Candidatus Aquicultorales bacterium]